MGKVSWVGRGGPLAPFADGYATELERLGFTHHSVVTHLETSGEDRFGFAAVMVDAAR